jgi:hypothetical protein
MAGADLVRFIPLLDGSLFEEPRRLRLATVGFCAAL